MNQKADAMAKITANLFCTIVMVLLIFIHSGTIQAADTGFTLVVTCSEKDAPKGSSPTVEIYISESLCCDGYDGLLKGLKRKKKGFYALDLTGIGKGKPLEPVHLQISRKPAGLLVTQYTRGLPPTLVPRSGGTVSFDRRFAEELVCNALFDTSKLE
jgi:hypothetical protein